MVIGCQSEIDNFLDLPELYVRYRSGAGSRNGSNVRAMRTRFPPKEFFGFGGLLFGRVWVFVIGVRSQDADGFSGESIERAFVEYGL